MIDPEPEEEEEDIMDVIARHNARFLAAHESAREDFSEHADIYDATRRRMKLLHDIERRA